MSFSPPPGPPQGMPPQVPPPQGYPPMPGGFPPAPYGTPPRGGANDLADGQWHRLHPLTPWMSAVPGLIATAFAIVVAVAPTFIGFASGPRSFGRNGGAFFGFIPLIVIVVCAIVIVGAFVSYRFTTFRITDEVVEQRSGVLAKHNRQVRLDRLQSVNVNRTLLARFFGLAALQTSGAGKDIDIRLSFLRAGEAEALRLELLRRASGAKRRDRSTGAPPAGYAAAPGAGYPPPASGFPPIPGNGAPGTPDGPGAAPVPYPTAPAAPGTGGHSPAPFPAPGTAGSSPVRPDSAGTNPAGPHPAPPHRRRLSDYIDEVVDDFSSMGAPDPGVQEQSVLRIPSGRVFASQAVQIGTYMLLPIAVVMIVFLSLGLAFSSEGPEAFWGAGIGTVFAVGFMILSIFLAAVGTTLSMMNYSISGTRDGIKISRGLINLTSDTVPPGRIHSVQINQPILWRPFGWYTVMITRADLQAGESSGDSSKQQTNQLRQTLLPVGTRDDVLRALELVLPMHMSPRTARIVDDGIAKGRRGGYVWTPARSWWLHPFSWRRMGFVLDRDVLYLRHGWLMRKLGIVPGERMQSVSLQQGPLGRLARVVTLSADTVSGPVSTRMPGIDSGIAQPLLRDVETVALRAAARDTSHRWSQARARTLLASSRMTVDDALRRGERPNPLAERVLAAGERYQADVAAGRIPAPGPDERADDSGETGPAPRGRRVKQ